MSRQASGLQAWALQRLTGIYLTGYIAYLLLYLLIGVPSSHEEWRNWLVNPWMSIASYVAILCILMHAWIGVRDVIIDYVKPAMLKVILLALIMLYLGACGIWAGKLLLLAELGAR